MKSPAPIIRIVLAVVFFGSGELLAQPANVALVPVQWANWPALQSFAIGEWQGEWLVLGGRTDGLHQRQPWAAFAASGQPNALWVLNPSTGGVWSAPLDSVPLEVRDQFKSSNPQFEVFGDWLYITGGYGLSSATGTHTTHPRITRIHLAQGIAAVKNGGMGLKNTLQTKVDARFAVSGGQMLAWNGQMVLLGGHRFEGAYNPMGHATYTQTYHQKALRWVPLDSANSFACSNFHQTSDTVRLHRRDWNVLPVRTANVAYLMGFSGVFQRGVDLPYTDGVAWDGDSTWTPVGLSQRLNQYHCATVGMYDSINQSYAALFFGGIAQYVPTPGGGLASDPNVPFVKTIGLISHDSGAWSERPLQTSLPAYFGATAEFIPAPNVPRDANGLIQLAKLPSDSAFLGYLFGGIESSAPNVFFGNATSQSQATSGLFQVYWIKGALSVHESNLGPSLVEWIASAGRGRGEARVLPLGNGPVELNLYDRSGRLVHKETNTRHQGEPFAFDFSIRGAATVLVRQGDRIASGEILGLDGR